jgi:hypothetical protein
MKYKIKLTHLLWFVLIITILGVFVNSVKAATLYSNKQTTGYAMGATSYNGHTFTRGDVATHALGYCNDLAGYWSRGTNLSMTSGIAIPGFWGFDPNYDIFWTFYKWDVGDLNCVKNAYWLDIYFSRYIKNGDTCICPGVTTPTGSCYTNANTNACTNATYYGAPNKDYYGH